MGMRGGGGGEEEGASLHHTAVTDKMFVCQLSYSSYNLSLGNMCPSNECLSTDCV